MTGITVIRLNLDGPGTTRKYYVIFDPAAGA